MYLDPQHWKKVCETLIWMTGSALFFSEFRFRLAYLLHAKFGIKLSYIEVTWYGARYR